MTNVNSAFGKNNFDRLEAAGLVASGDSESVRAKLQTRIQELHSLEAKITKVEAHLADLHVQAKPQRLKILTSVLGAVKKLHASKLPVGAKKHVEHCLNELTSLREGVYSSNATIDKSNLTLVAAAQAKADIRALAAQAATRLDKVEAGSTGDELLDEFYKKSKDVIDRNASQAANLLAIKDKPYVIARSPVVPADGMVSTDKLANLGFKVENLSGYAVLHNQLVIGINPKFLLGDKAGEVKGEKTALAIRAEVDRLRKLLQKKLRNRLQLVSDKSFTYKQGTWFWLMTDKDIDAFAKAFPGRHVKVSRWGFAHN